MLQTITLLNFEFISIYCSLFSGSISPMQKHECLLFSTHKTSSKNYFDGKWQRSKPNGF